MKNRRGVGGLISLVGLVVVFGVVATAFIELSAGQADLVSTTIDVNTRLVDKNNELLKFTGVGPAPDSSITVKNLGGKSATLESYLVVNGKTITDVEYLDKKINPGKNSDITFSPDLQSGDEIILVTKLGKKCLILVDEGDSQC